MWVRHTSSSIGRKVGGLSYMKHCPFILFIWAMKANLCICISAYFTTWPLGDIRVVILPKKARISFGNSDEFALNTSQVFYRSKFMGQTLANTLHSAAPERCALHFIPVRNKSDLSDLTTSPGSDIYTGDRIHTRGDSLSYRRAKYRETHDEAKRA